MRSKVWSNTTLNAITALVANPKDQYRSAGMEARGIEVMGKTGSHICRGLKGEDPPKVRDYAALLCSMCGGNFAVELPEDDFSGIGKGDGAVIDKRRFAYYLD